MCTMYMPGILGGQRNAWSPPELELSAAVSLYMGAGNRIQIFCKSSQPLSYLSLALFLCVFKEMLLIH